MTKEWLGDHDMAKSAQFARGFGQRVNRQVDSWNELVANGKRRLLEMAGAALVLLSFLVAVALLTYNPADASFDTASEASPANFLGRDGALVADVLVQGLGLAAFLVPLILLGWAFRLLLQRPPRRMGRRLLLVAPALVLGAFACSVLRIAPLPLPAGSGGIVGWEVLRLLPIVDLAALELPLAMGAAALVALMLLSIMGLSWGDWRDVGSGAGRGATRLAVASGQGAVIGAAAAVGFSQRVVERWRAARGRAETARTAPAAARALGPRRPLPWARPRPRATTHRRRPSAREPRFGARVRPLRPAAAALAAPQPEAAPGRRPAPSWSAW